MSRPRPLLDDVNAPYYAGTAAGELRICHCPQCDALFVFTHAWCPECWSQDLGYKVSSGRGQIETFSIIYQAPYEGMQDKVPYVLALITLEEGVRMMSNVVGSDPEQIAIGLPVEVAFEALDELKLPVFRLAPVD